MRKQGNIANATVYNTEFEINFKILELFRQAGTSDIDTVTKSLDYSVEA